MMLYVVEDLWFNKLTTVYILSIRIECIFHWRQNVHITLRKRKNKSEMFNYPICSLWKYYTNNDSFRMLNSIKKKFLQYRILVKIWMSPKHTNIHENRNQYKSKPKKNQKKIYVHQVLSTRKRTLKKVLCVKSA